ncbi:MAG: hypothetical protein ABIR46_01590 [Candidatus Saccharimonadales bacterium]
MNTLISNALKVTCAVMFAVATSGIIPATAYAIKPTSSPANAAEHRNANAYEHGPKTTETITEQAIAPTMQDTSTAASIQSSTVINPQASQKPATVAAKLHNPSGNNGFIKVNEEEVPDSIPNNDPHVGCTFKVEFYNYDQNPNYRANVSFALHNPTVKDGQTMTVIGDQNPFIGEDAAGGGNDLDAVKTYKLAFSGKAHEKQGYHVKLTINADGSRGADVKHKVFWVKPCAQPGQGGHVLPSETTTTPGKTLSTSTVRSSATLPSKLPSTGARFNLVVSSLIALLTIATYFAVLRIQRLVPEEI